MMKRILLTFCCMLLPSFFLVSQEAAPLQDGVYARMLTPRGELLFELDYKTLPLTVSNFVAQAEGKMGSSLYQDLSFYRTIPGYALFSGGQLESGDSDADYSFPRETGSLYSAGESGAPDHGIHAG